MPKRQCWECARRRLVCDCSTPFCNKCFEAGKACPGYGAKEPLKWLTPGMTRCSTQHRRPWATGKRWCYTAATEKTMETTETHEGHNKALKINASLGELKPDDSAIVEAALYFNSNWYAEYATMQQPTPNPYLAPFPVELLHLMPMSLCHSFACLAFTHRAQRSSLKTGCFQSIEMPPRIFYHRGLAIGALSDEVGNVKSGNNDSIIASVLMFLISEIRLSPSNWRHNFYAAVELVKLQGGFENLSRSSLSMQPSLLCLLIIGVVANTTTPAPHHIPVASGLGIINVAVDLYSDHFCPGFTCPPYLFLDIIRINHFRLQTTKTAMNAPAQLSALALFQHVESFCSEEWAGSKSSARDDWLLIGDIYRSAVALYCISSLQCMSVLPATSELNQSRATHRRHLFSLLRRAFLSARLKKCMMWPLVVAGMNAVDVGSETRHLVDKQLAEASWELGTPAPLVARVVFQRFWASEKTTWDDCFDASYCFLF